MLRESLHVALYGSARVVVLRALPGRLAGQPIAPPCQCLTDCVFSINRVNRGATSVLASSAFSRLGSKHNQPVQSGLAATPREADRTGIAPQHGHVEQPVLVNVQFRQHP